MLRAVGTDERIDQTASGQLGEAHPNNLAPSTQTWPLRQNPEDFAIPAEDARPNKPGPFNQNLAPSQNPDVFQSRSQDYPQMNTDLGRRKRIVSPQSSAPICIANRKDGLCDSRMFRREPPTKRANNVAKRWDPAGRNKIEPLAAKRLATQECADPKTKCKNPRAPDCFVDRVRDAPDKMHPTARVLDPPPVPND